MSIWEEVAVSSLEAGDRFAWAATDTAKTVESITRAGDGRYEIVTRRLHVPTRHDEEPPNAVMHRAYGDMIVWRVR